MIYTFSLVSSASIIISSSFHPPALIATNHQIRHEAIPLFYTSNTFRMLIHNCDISLYQAYTANAAIPDWVKEKWVWRLHISGFNWENLVKWCRAVWEGGMGRNHLDENASKGTAVIQMATSIAARGELEWKGVLELLESLKVVARNFDRSWVE